MNELAILLLSIAIAACIGGVTNFLAIRMLFHPHHPWKIFGQRVPFTPGIIPKRRQQIAHSLGRVVADFLVTREGLLGFLNQPSIKQKLQAKCEKWLEAAASEQQTWEQLCRKWISEEKWTAWKQQGKGELDALLQREFKAICRSSDWLERPLQQWFPTWNEDAKQQLSSSLATWLAKAIHEELNHREGDQMLRGLIQAFLHNSGSFMGALAGIFMHEERLLNKVRTAILELVKHPAFQQKVAAVAEQNISAWEQKSVLQLARELTGNRGLTEEEICEGLAKRLSSEVDAGKILQKGLDFPAGRLVKLYKEQLLSLIPVLLDGLWSRLDPLMDRLLHTLELETLVAKQVAAFPLTRVEGIILEVSGKEFRAITWLGAVLGGMIGLCQAILYLYIL